MSKSLILIVDDDVNNLQILGNTLRKNNMDILIATSGAMAMDYLKDYIPDLIVLDVMMPEMDGYELCKIIKQDKQYKEVPVIFLSALNSPSDIIKGLKVGAVDFIVKPFNTNTILYKINIQLELKRKTEELKSLNKTLELKVNKRTEELSNANRELQQLDFLKSEFLKIISHEIRTPLNGIIGFSNILKEECKSDKVKLYLDILDDSVSRLERFSLKALLYTQLKSEKYKLYTEDVDINKILKILQNNFKKKIDEKNLQIIYNDQVFLIKSEQNLIFETIESIFRNAIHHSPVNGKIFINFYNNGSEIVCSISDEGPGFSKKALKNLFRIFIGGEENYSNGQGLDLALCKLIMNIHKGDIVVKNQEKGAIVELIFKTE
jgi:two-component system, sensor histidine kinase and response regulator